MITDRDICMAIAMRDTKPSGISVEEVMTGQVYAVKPDDNVDQALQTMQEHKIRRLPVVSSEGELEGILSMNDMVLNARDRRNSKGFDRLQRSGENLSGDLSAPGTRRSKCDGFHVERPG